MAISRVAPELRDPVRKIPAIPVHRYWGRQLGRLLPAHLPAPRTAGVIVEQAAPRVPGVRVYRPEHTRSPAALLWIHGGGLVIGAARMNDHLCGKVAAELGIVVVSADYRLAPEHPFPVPLDDCHAAWSHLQDKAGQWGVDPRRVVVGGQSAGGGLGAALVQQLRDEDDVRPIGQWLWCPMLDDRTAARRELDQPSHWVWDNQRNHFGWRSYLAAEPGAATFPPYAVPARRDDLAGLPPAWIGVGDIDLFHDEDQVYAARLTEAGVPVTFTVVPDAPHGFEVWGSETVISRTHIGTALDWLRATISD